MRLAIVTNVPAPYRLPLYELLDVRLRERGGGVTIIYGAREASGFQWPDDVALRVASRSVFLNRRPLRVRGHNTYINPLVVSALRTARPDVVVLGGFAPWMYPAVLWCRSSGVPYLLWSGVTYRSAQSNGFRRRLRGPLIRGASGLLAYGPDARKYLLAVGAEPARVEVLGNGIDVDAFAARVEQARKDREELRHRLGLVGTVALSVGAKGLELARNAVRGLEGTATLLVAGVAASGREPSEVSLGRVPSARMPELYASADCLAHLPVFDYWPHAINEALAGGLPVVATPDSGVAEEVLTGPGCNVVRAEVAAVAEAIQSAAAVGASESAEIRDAIRGPLRPWAVDRMAERFITVAERVARTGARA